MIQVTKKVSVLKELSKEFGKKELSFSKNLGQPFTLSLGFSDNFDQNAKHNIEITFEVLGAWALAAFHKNQIVT